MNCVDHKHYFFYYNGNKNDCTFNIKTERNAGQIYLNRMTNYINYIYNTNSVLQDYPIITVCYIYLQFQHSALMYTVLVAIITHSLFVRQFRLQTVVARRVYIVNFKDYYTYECHITERYSDYILMIGRNLKREFTINT